MFGDARALHVRQRAEGAKPSQPGAQPQGRKRIPSRAESPNHGYGRGDGAGFQPCSALPGILGLRPRLGWDGPSALATRHGFSERLPRALLVLRPFKRPIAPLAGNHFPSHNLFFGRGTKR